jgi:YVTN family beta-propeller protein
MGMNGGRRQRERRTIDVPLVRLALILVLGGLLMCGALAGAPVARGDGGAPNLAYVVGGGSGGNDLTIVDVSKRQVTGHVQLRGAPSAVVLSFDARSAYVAEPGANAVAIVDTHALTVAATIPAGSVPSALALGYSRGTVALFVAASGSNAVQILDLSKRRVVSTIAVGTHPSSVALAAPGSGIVTSDINDEELYVANIGDDTVSVISTNQQKVIATIPVPGGPLGVVVPATGGVAYVGTRSGTILALSLAHHTLLGAVIRLPDGHTPGQMDYNAVTGEIYVPDPAGNQVYVLRPVSAGVPGQPFEAPAEPARTLPVAGGPAAVAITFDGALGFVAARDAGRVEMLDVAAHRSLASIAVGGSPRAIITGPYPPPESGAGNIAVGDVIGLLAAVIAVVVAVLAVGALAVVAWRAWRSRRSAPKGPVS